MGMIGGWELLLIFFIVLILFGARRLPEIAQSLGKSVQEFKRAKDDVLTYTKEDKKAHQIPPEKEKLEASSDEIK